MRNEKIMNDYEQARSSDTYAPHRQLNWNQKNAKRSCML